MTRRAAQLASVLLLLMCGVFANAAEVIDRIIVTVNGKPLLQSDLEDSVRFEAFLQQRKPETFTVQEREAALNRLIDQELLRQQMQGDFTLDASQVDARIAEVRSQLQSAGTDQGWQKLLSSYGLDEQLLREKLGAQLQVLHFVDLRLRPTLRIDHDAIEAYYRDTLVPQLQRMGATVEPLSSVASKIQEVLAQQRMDEMLTAWLANLRSQSEIHVSQATPVHVSAVLTNAGKGPKEP